MTQILRATIATTEPFAPNLVLANVLAFANLNRIFVIKKWSDPFTAFSRERICHIEVISVNLFRPDHKTVLIGVSNNILQSIPDELSKILCLHLHP